MSPHRVLRRRALVLMGLLATAGAPLALSTAPSGLAVADTLMVVPGAAERGAEAQPGLRNEPLVDPRAERTSRTDASPADIYLVPYGIERGICDRRQLANDAFGGVVGLVGGSTTSEPVVATRRNRAAHGVAGAASGPLTGPKAARVMDDVDHQCIGRTLEYAPDNHRVRWLNEAKEQSYIVVPMRTFQNQNGLYCREYVTSAMVAGKSLETLASACRGANGAWKLLRSD